MQIGQQASEAEQTQQNLKQHVLEVPANTSDSPNFKSIATEVNPPPIKTERSGSSSETPESPVSDVRSIATTVSTGVSPASEVRTIVVPADSDNSEGRVSPSSEIASGNTSPVDSNQSSPVLAPQPNLFGEALQAQQAQSSATAHLPTEDKTQQQTARTDLDDQAFSFGSSEQQNEAKFQEHYKKFASKMEKAGFWKREFVSVNDYFAKHARPIAAAKGCEVFFEELNKVFDNFFANALENDKFDLRGLMEYALVRDEISDLEPFLMSIKNPPGDEKSIFHEPNLGFLEKFRLFTGRVKLTPEVSKIMGACNTLHIHLGVSINPLFILDEKKFGEIQKEIKSQIPKGRSVKEEKTDHTKMIAVNEACEVLNNAHAYYKVRTAYALERGYEKIFEKVKAEFLEALTLASKNNDFVKEKAKYDQQVKEEKEKAQVINSFTVKLQQFFEKIKGKEAGFEIGKFQENMSRIFGAYGSNLNYFFEIIEKIHANHFVNAPKEKLADRVSILNFALGTFAWHNRLDTVRYIPEFFELLDKKENGKPHPLAAQTNLSDLQKFVLFGEIRKHREAFKLAPVKADDFRWQYVEEFFNAADVKAMSGELFSLILAQRNEYIIEERVDVQIKNAIENLFSDNGFKHNNLLNLTKLREKLFKELDCFLDQTQVQAEKAKGKNLAAIKEKVRDELVKCVHPKQMVEVACIDYKKLKQEIIALQKDYLLPGVESAIIKANIAECVNPEKTKQKIAENRANYVDQKKLIDFYVNRGYGVGEIHKEVLNNPYLTIVMDHVSGGIKKLEKELKDEKQAIDTIFGDKCTKSKDLNEKITELQKSGKNLEKLIVEQVRNCIKGSEHNHVISPRSYYMKEGSTHLQKKLEQEAKKALDNAVLTQRRQPVLDALRMVVGIVVSIPFFLLASKRYRSFVARTFFYTKTAAKIQTTTANCEQSLKRYERHVEQGKTEEQAVQAVLKFNRPVMGG